MSHQYHDREDGLLHCTMKLTPFGNTVRMLRMRYDASLKDMAEALGIRSSYLSGMEYGNRRLTDKHIECALAFFLGKATAEELAQLRVAAERSKDLLALDSLCPDARGFVVAFARRLQEGAAPHTAPPGRCPFCGQSVVRPEDERRGV